VFFDVAFLSGACLLEPPRPVHYNLPHVEPPPQTTPAGKSVTPDLVRNVAKLARLTVDEAELPKLTGQIESILGYVAAIGRADVAGVEPMAHALPLHNVLRSDEAGPALPREKVLENAPETDGQFFKVPKVIGGDEDSAG
jgi:aspartyl-tRNA(Asn)/glutamyl-tRNA(Gln) amidotransferase subunit C